MIIALMFITLAVLVFIFYFSKYKDWLQPNMVFLIIWLLTSAWSSIDYDDFMSPWSYSMYIVTLLSAFSFWLGSLFIYFTKRSYSYRRQPIYLPKIYGQLVLLLYIVGLSCFLLEWVIAGAQISLPFTKDSDAFDVKTSALAGIPFIHYGVIILPYIYILALFQYFNNNLSFRNILIISIPLLLISLFVKGSRGDLLTYLLSFVFLYSRYKKIHIRHLLIFGATFFLIIIGVMFLRLNKASVIYSTNQNPYISVFYSYIATSYANLNDLINLDFDQQIAGPLTFSPLWTLTGFKDSFNPILLEQLGVFNARTYLYGFFHDYGYIGITIFPFILGLFLSSLYHKSIGRSSYWIALLASLQKAIFVPFFGNYFTSELVVLFPYIFIYTFILLMFSFQKKNRAILA